MENVRRHIYDQVANHELDQSEAKKLLLELKKAEIKSDTDIAVIGMSGRFPNASDIYSYWENIKNGVKCIREIPQNRIKDCEDFIKRFYYDDLIKEGSIKDDGHLDLKYDIRGYLDEIDKFDAHFFKIPPREAKSMDPCQRLFLEESYAALEDAGYSFDAINGSNTGVFVGMDHVAELKYKRVAASDPMVVTGTWPGILASRVSYVFNLKGPSMVIDTACSSGLVSMHEACKSINTGECNMAVVGGISSFYYKPTQLKSEYSELGSIESVENKVKVFDQDADGTVWGEGVGVVILKKLSKAIEDGDPIHAVIKGSAINNDGASNGITAPDVQMQKELLISAWENSRVDPETIQYIETHGTGTKLGDPIEIKAITEAFKKSTKKKQFCGVGSVKSNIGHLVAASGIASLIKVILMLKNKVIAPTINFSEPNEFINFINSPVYVADRYSEWIKKEKPRRAGVSSFGFSGTNCHAVIEEAPSVHSNVKIKEKKFEIFTISAKSKNSFNKLIERYYYYLKDEEENFYNACYTSKIGRGHYSYRLALLVENYDDLIEKLSIVLNSNLDDLNCEGIYFGVHKIVSENKRIKENGEITEGQRRMLNNLSQEKIADLLNNINEISAKELCELYVKGATIKWNEFYKGEKIQKLNLPVYPFEKTRYWFEQESKNLEQSIINVEMNYKKIKHPLIDRCLVESMYQDIYETIFSVDKQWVLSEHKIFSNHVLPGTAYIEMAIQACKKYYPDSIQLRDVIFYKPLILQKDEERKIQTILTKKEDYIQVTVASKVVLYDSNEEWIQHCECKVSEIKKENILNEYYDIMDIKNRLNNEVCEKRLININKEGSKITLGARWQNDKVISVGRREALIELELPEALAEDIDMFTLHTALFDNSVNAVSQKIGEGLYLPFYFKNIMVYKALGSKFYSYIKIREETNKDLETITFDVNILDCLGNVIVKVENYSIKKVNKSEAQFKNSYENNNSYFTMKWINVENTINKEEPNNDTILIFKNKETLSEKLVEKLINKDIGIIEVEAGKKYRKVNENKYEIDNSEYDYNKLFKDIKNRNITKIIHMLTISEREVFNLNELNQVQDKGINSLFYMVRALIENKYNKTIDILLISNYANEITGDEKVINPHNAAFLSLGMVIEKEHFNLRCRSIDIDNNVSKEEIINELWSSENLNKIAYRNGKRYVQEFSRAYCESKGKVKFDIKEDGVYVITGGIGGLGLEVGKHIAQINKTKIVLISRTQIPEKEEWNNILLGKNNKKIKRAIKYIKEMEGLGSEVINIRANVCNEKEISSVFEDLRENYGEIKGIVHCAGLAGDGFIIRKDKDAFEKVLAPKIYGTWILDDLTKNDNLDFFVMFSSILSVFGDVGQGDYVAGNSYMDSFAALRNKKGKRTVAINWPSWKETGMAVDYEVNNNGSLIEAIETYKALNSFDEIINSDLNQVIPGTLNYSRFIEIKDEMRFKLSDEIENIIIKSGMDSRKEVKKEKEVTATIKGKRQDGYTETENAIARVWCRVLGLDEIDVYDSFYSLGGDSLIAIELLKEVEKKYEGILDITNVFTYPTVVQMASYIDEKLGNMVNSDENNKEKEEVLEKKEEIEGELSNTQERIWFLQKMEPKLIAYNLPIRLFNEEVDYNLLNEAFNTVIKRHDALRTVFREKDGTPYQIVLKELEYNIEFCDLSEEKNPYELMETMMKEDDKAIFDLKNSLYIVKLYKIRENKYCLYVNIHHIIVDGWSCGILKDEIIEIYRAKKESREVKLQSIKNNYIDYVKGIKKWLKTEDAKIVEEYWISELKNPLPILNLPTDYKRPRRQTYNGSYINVKISKEDTIKIKKVAQELNTTLHIFLLSVYYVLLNRVTGDRDIIVGVPVSGRQLKGFEKTVGLFINMVSIRVNMEDDLLSFVQLLEKVKEKSINAYKNSLYPFDLIVSKINVLRDLSRSPVFSTTFQYYDHIPFDNDGISQFDISVSCRESDEQLVMRFEYNSDLFMKETVEWYGKYLKNIIYQICNNSSINLRNIELLKEEESNEIIKKFTGDMVDFDRVTMHELFEERVITNGSNKALLFRNESITYEELNKKANKLANLLREKEKIKIGEPIGIMMERGMDMIIAMIAVLKVGGAYIPIDPVYPKSRISFMINNSEVKTLISQEGSKDKIEELIKECSLQVVVNISSDFKEFKSVERIYGMDDIEMYSDENLQLSISDDSPMYIIYTSGSTGLPKGVAVSHANAVNYTKWSIEEGDINPKDKMMLVTSMSFDISVFEIFAALTSGCELTIVPEDILRDTYQLLDYIEEKQVNIWHSVPTLMSQALIVLRNNPQGYSSVRNIRRIMIGGEAWSTEVAKEIGKEFKNSEVVNMYGPTETTIWVTSYNVDENVVSRNSLPIGKPIWNNKILILEDNMKLCGVGIVGNIYVSGRNVALGYFKDKQKTDLGFIKEKGEILYRTGDLGRYLSDGNIEYMGRKDTLVKVHGYRIEIGEIENVMLEDKTIKEAAVIVKKIGESSKLVCFYTSDKLYTVEELRNRLGEKLPYYMIPSLFTKLRYMPHTSNGKVDRNCLEKIDVVNVQETGSNFVEANTDIEKTLIKIWSQLLGHRKIGINDNFFSLGGDSFLVSKMHSMINKIYPNKVRIVDIFTYTTIFRLANLIAKSDEVLREEDRISNEINELLHDIEAGEVDILEATRKMSDMEV